MTAMKKLILFALFATGLSSISAVNENVYKYNYEFHKPYYKGQKGNISPESLPKSITKYLKKHYSDYEIIVSKRKNNGKYFVKIRFGGNNQHSYYRSLVFDHEGKVIKG